jgi:pimeloyl-ACP methyl ester carboxylesterase
MRVVANGIGIEVDDSGPPNGEPLLMIMGLGMQLIAWPDAMVQRLVGEGFRVIRFDNRDAGLSEGFDALGVPSIGWAALRYGLRLPVTAPYRLADMAADARGVLDALGIGRAHVCGASMGGMVAQHLAAAHPRRVKSLTLMMTSSGARHLPGASPGVRRVLLSRPSGAGEEARIERLERLFRTIGSPAYPSEPQALRRRLEATVRRAYRPAGLARQLVAVVADGDRSRLLRALTMPTHVLHGAADPLVPAAAASDLASKIGGATLDLVDGMGHDLPVPLLPRFVRGIAEVAARA